MLVLFLSRRGGWYIAALRVRWRDEPANLSRHSDDGLSQVRGGCRHIAARRVCRRVADQAAQGGGLGGLDGGRGQVGDGQRVLARSDEVATAVARRREPHLYVRYGQGHPQHGGRGT